jgi:6-phosphogluconolactonase
LTQLSYVPGNQHGFGIVANPAATFLYTDDVNNGGIDGFSIGASGALTPVAGSPFPMPSGWSVLFVDSLAIDPAGKFLYAPDSASNVIAGFTLNGSTGAVTPISGSPFAAGQGPQQVVVHSSGRFLYASDGNDPQGSISAFTIDASTGALTPISGSPFPIALGNGSDGLLTDPSGKFLYATVPLSNCIAAFTIDGTTGALTPVPGSPFTPDLAGTFPIIYSIALTPSGKYLYALGAENARLYAFAVDASSGALTSIAGSPFNIEIGTYFSGLEVDPSGKFLYIGTETGSIFTMNVDETTGALSPDAGQANYAYGPTSTIIKSP